MSDSKPAGNQVSKDELEQLALWQQAGKQLAMATVVRTWGSSPRQPGSHLVIDDQANFVGSVSGGCIEGAVVSEALETIDNGKSQLLEFGVSNEQAWEVGLSCGGAIEIYLERMSTQGTLKHPFQQLAKDRRAKRPVALVTRLEDGNQCLVYLNSQSGDQHHGELTLSNEAIAATRDMLSRAASGVLEQIDQGLFVRSYVPAARMLIIGAVHIAQVLAPMATLAGFQVTVIDPRRAFGQLQRFPDISLSNDWPDEALQQINIDAQTAVVTLSHDPKIDDPAIIEALHSPAFYIGCLGSSRTHAQRVERLTEQGLGDLIDRIQAPVGLNLGGRAPEEIAVAILAQVIQTRHQDKPL